MIRPLSWLNRSLTRQAIFWIGLLTTLAILAGLAWGYLQTQERSTARILDDMRRQAVLHAQLESRILSDVVDSHAMLREALVRHWNDPTPPDVMARLEAVTEARPDGTRRSRADHFDGKVEASLFVGRGVTLDPQLARRTLLIKALAEQHGQSWKRRFIDTWITLRENVDATYYPSQPDYNMRLSSSENGQAAYSEFYSEYNRRATVSYNPHREMVWEELTMDKVSGDWSVTVVTPVDIGGIHVATLGHDLDLADLKRRIDHSALPGGYSFLMRRDGLLLYHPRWLSAIQQHDGMFTVHDSRDPLLIATLDAMLRSGGKTAVLDQPDLPDYVALAPLAGPDWVLATAYPRHLVAARVQRDAAAVLWMGLALVTVELLLLYVLLRRIVAQPLGRLVRALDSFAEGERALQLPVRSQNELGLLAQAFNRMAVALGKRDRALREHADQLQSEVERQTAVLASAHERVWSTLQAIADAVATSDAEGRVQHLNPAAERLTGWRAEEAQGQPLDDILPLSRYDKGAAASWLELMRAPDSVFDLPGDIVLHPRDGEPIPLAGRVAALPGADGRAGWVVVCHDDSAARSLTRTLRYEATHDPLTGLLNRNGLRAAWPGTLADGPHSLLLLDLDGFKWVNDQAGHAAGDALLRELTVVLATELRVGDMLARLGGDEFVVLLPHCSVESARQLAERLRQAVRDYVFENQGRRFQVGVSIGVTALPVGDGALAQALGRADSACYQAKRAGRDQVVVLEDSSGESGGK